jgi:ABC-type Fe3+-hydroxamate transport system substrate-binding protein
MLAGRRALLGLLTLSALGCREQRAPAADAGKLRVVSLAPAITETLFALGAGELVVGISDYCNYPPEALKLPKLGTSITPHYEAIARLAPSLIVSERGASARQKELEALAPTLLLPWLTLEEVASGIETLGARVGHQGQGKSLAGELRRRLAVPEPKAGPRVLLVLGYEPGKLDEVWFVRKNSLHGAALHAAGARNAVPDAYEGAPRIGQERVLELDPDAILILLRPGEETRSAAYLKDWEVLSGLTAVQKKRVRPLAVAEAFANGPRIVKLADRLQQELRALGVAP